MIRYCFVVDANGKPLAPTKEVKAWYMIRKGKATLVNKYPMTIQYVAGYYNKEDLVYEIFVLLVTETEDVMTDLVVTDDGIFDSSKAYLSKDAVTEWANANQITEEYDVMFSFIPKNASVNTTYNLVFTEK